MSLCYDGEKWLMITLASIAITLTVGLVSLVYGQTDAQQQREALLDYCFQHADRPNPLQDLIDKGLLSETFTGETCKSVKQAYDEEQTKNLDREMRHHYCLTNKSKTTEECDAILVGPYHECMANPSKVYEDCRGLEGENILPGIG